MKSYSVSFFDESQRLKDVSPTHSHIFGKLPPFFSLRDSRRPESPIQNTSLWLNNPHPVFIPDRIYFRENKNCRTLSGIVKGICVKIYSIGYSNE